MERRRSNRIAHREQVQPWDLVRMVQAQAEAVALALALAWARVESQMLEVQVRPRMPWGSLTEVERVAWWEARARAKARAKAKAPSARDLAEVYWAMRA
jgi:hypothetical protein